MWRSLCSFLMICIPLIRSASVLIDGAIDIKQNWDFEFSPPPKSSPAVVTNEKQNTTTSPQISTTTKKSTINIILAQQIQNAIRTAPDEVFAVISNLTGLKRRNVLSTKVLPLFKKKFKRRSNGTKTLETKAQLAKHKNTIPFVNKAHAIQSAHTNLSEAKYAPTNSQSSPPPYYYFTSSGKTNESKKIISVAWGSTHDSNLFETKTVKIIKRFNGEVFITKKSYDPYIERITRHIEFESDEKPYTTTKKKKKHKHNHVTQHTTSYPTVTPIGNDISFDLRTLAASDGEKLIDILGKFGITLPPNPISVTPHFFTTPQYTYDKRNRMSNLDNQENYDKPHYVRNDVRIQNFTLNIFKQNINVFENLKQKLNETKMKRKIDFIARSYRNKFAKFVNETQYQKVVTRLGTQKVVLNIIQTSNRIMRRLLNFLLVDMVKSGVLRESDTTAFYWRNQMENEEQQEYVQACQKFNICRSNYMLSSFIADYFTVLLQVTDQKLKQGMDAMTEVLKFSDFGDIFDAKIKKRVATNIDFLERADGSLLRQILWMLRNMLITKNQPLAVQERVPRKVINQTVAFMDAIDILDEKIPANEENVLEWNDVKNSLVQWANGQRSDILEIMQAFVGLIRKGAIKMNMRSTSDFRSKLKIFLDAK